MQIFRKGDTLGYDPDARVLVMAAALHAQRSGALVTPESLLLVALEDPELSSGLAGELEGARAALERDRPRWVHERASSLLHWSQPARAALDGAGWRTISRGRRAMTRGDLVSGLARAGGLAGPIAARLVPDWYDGALRLRPAGPGACDVWIVNDDVTPMDFVAFALQSHFGITELGALYRMLRTHLTGRAHVGSWSETEATERVRAAVAQARAAGFPLHFGVSTVVAA
jgi:ATP-dependent Clp protease adaptor protein ClpS